MGRRRARRAKCAAAIAVALIGTCAVARAALAADESPTQVVENLHAGMLEVMRADLPYAQRFERLAPILEQAYDLDFMAKKALGGAWDKLDPEQQERWRTSFRTFMIANYAGRMRAYHDQHFASPSEEPSAQDTVLVSGKVVEPGAETIDLTYRLRKTSAGWRVMDVYLKGTVSELALRRSDFSAVLEREGFAALLASVNRKIDDLATGNVK